VAQTTGVEGTLRKELPCRLEVGTGVMAFELELKEQPVGLRNGREGQREGDGKHFFGSTCYVPSIIS
jgi:hypothetical protein